MNTFIIITCEHGGNTVPSEFSSHFEAAAAALDSHRGWDIGILPLAKSVAGILQVPFYESTISRLVVDLNRSLHHPQIFSSYMAAVPQAPVLEKYYFPYRESVATKIRQLTTLGQVIHISFHSFTPIWDGQVRPTDIGILYDESSGNEARFAASLKQLFALNFSGLTIAENDPYKGTDDGFVTHLRTFFPTEKYIGIELEINQKFAPQMLLFDQRIACSLLVAFKTLSDHNQPMDHLGIL